MKPSKRIQEISENLMDKNEGLKELKAMPDSEAKIQFITQIGCAIQIQAIIDYLDEQQR